MTRQPVELYQVFVLCVLLSCVVDGRTDRTVAQEAVVSGRHERFTWIEVSHFDASKRREVLAHLFT